MFEQISTPEILKWVILVFIAGFIGFFGKYLGRVVISLFQRKKKGAARTSSLPGQTVKPGVVDIQAKGDSSTRLGGGMSREEQKLLKKALKNEVKAKKKSEKQ